MTNSDRLVSPGMAVESLPDARRCCARVHSGQVCNLILPLGPKFTLDSPNNTVEIGARDPEFVMQLWNSSSLSITQSTITGHMNFETLVNPP